MSTSSTSSLPRHPIRVAAARSGLTPTVLRAWERRYGVVHPGRTEGGQRLYSDDDVERLALLRAATEAGRTIGRVAAMESAALRELVEEDRSAAGPQSAASPDRGDAQPERLVEVCMSAVERMDSEALETELRRALVTLGVRGFTDHLVVPLVERIGEGWADGSLRPAHEHVASEVIRRVLAWTAAQTGTEATGPVALVATLSGEEHELGALLAAVTAAYEGWRVTYLGPDLPPEEIVLAARTLRASLVGVSVVNALTADGIEERFAALLTQLPTDIPVGLGGAHAQELAMRVGDGRVRVVESLPALRLLLGELRAG